MFDVLLFGRLVGTLERRGRGVRFTYAPDALNDRDVPALSLSLPKQPEPYPDRLAGPFFRNLLPEQAYRRLVAAAARTAPENDLGLLGAIGGECPGAVSIWPRGERPSEPPDYRRLDRAALDALFSRTDRQPFASAHTRGRLSLAGVQEKIALFRDVAGQWQLPLNGAVTTHILKQAAAEFPYLLENELFCMLLGQAAGLEVATVGLAAPDLPILCADRFDRVWEADRPVRLHQEDFCQVLGVDPARKYQRDGGPGIRRCADVIMRHSSAPAIDLDRMVRWVGFNYLIGNEDAHAKNLAFLYQPTGLALTPHYDLVSTEVYPGLERSLSMKVGRAWDIRDVKGSDWQRLATQVRLPWSAVRTALSMVREQVAAVLGETEAQAATGFGPCSVYAEIAALVRRRLEQLGNALARTRG